MARENLGECPLPRFRYGIVRAIRIGDSKVLLPAEVARNVQNDARAAPLHARRKLVDQRVVRDEIGFHGAVPFLKGHIHHHLFSTGDTCVIDEEIDLPKALDSVLEELLHACLGADIDIRQDQHAIFRLGPTGAAKFRDDVLSRFLQLRAATCGEQHSRPCHGEITPQLQADAETSPGDDCRLAVMEARKDSLNVRRHGRLAGGLTNALGNPEIDRVHVPNTIVQRHGPVDGKREVVVLAVVVAHELIRYKRPGADAPSNLLLVFITPDADQLLDGSTLDLVEAVAVAVVRIGHVGNRGGAVHASPAREIAGDARCDRDWRDHLRLDELLDFCVVCSRKRIDLLGVGHAGQHDDAVQSMEMIGQELEDAVNGGGAQGVQVLYVDGADAHRIHPRLGAAGRLHGAHGEDHSSALAQMPFGEGEWFLDFIARDNQDDLA